MAMRIVNDLRQSMMDLINTAIGTSGLVKIYEGGVNASRGSAPSGTLLGTLTLSATAFASSNGVLTLNTVTEDPLADANGTAGSFTITTSGGTIKMDGTVTATGGGGDLTMNTVNIVENGPIGITGGSLTLT